MTDAGRTVIFSSHLLDEIERVSDHLMMLHRGGVQLCAPLEAIKAEFRRIVLHFELPQPDPPTVPGAVWVSGAERVWTVICEASVLERAAITRNFGARITDESPASLDELFIAHTGVAREALPDHPIAV